MNYFIAYIYIGYVVVEQMCVFAFKGSIYITNECLIDLSFFISRLTVVSREGKEEAASACPN